MSKSVVLLLLTSIAGAQHIHNMTFAGHVRQYYVTIPPGPPTGLIIALAPAEIEDAMWFCRTELGNVSAETGAMVVWVERSDRLGGLPLGLL